LAKLLSKKYSHSLFSSNKAEDAKKQAEIEEAENKEYKIKKYV
jgi:hypothetical protein